MPNRYGLRTTSAALLALLLSGTLLVAACTDDDPSTTPAEATATAGGGEATGLGGSDVAAGSEFTSSHGLFAMRYPEGWTVEEHADGGGVTLGSSGAAIEAAGTGAPPSSELAFSLTFVPAELFRLVDVDSEAPTEGVVQLLAPTDGSDPAAPEIVELPGGRVVAELRAAGDAVGGAIYVFDAAPGVFGVASVSAAPGEYEPMRDLVLAMLDSLEFSGDAESLIEILDPPPTTPGVFG